MVEGVDVALNAQRREVGHGDRADRHVAAVAGGATRPRVHDVVAVVADVATARGVVGGVAVGLPHRPEPVDVAVVQVEERVVRGGVRVAHVAGAGAARTADPAVHGVVHLVARGEAVAGLEGALERGVGGAVQGVAQVDRRGQRRGQAHPAAQRADPLAAVDRVGRRQVPAGEPGRPPRGRRRGVGAHARRCVGEVAAPDDARRVAVRAQEGVGHDRGRVGPVPVGHHHAGHLVLQQPLDVQQEVAVPAEEAVRAEAAVAEVDAEPERREGVLDHPVQAGQLVPPAVLVGGGRPRVDDLGLEQDAGPDEVLLLGHGQELGVLAHSHGGLPFSPAAPGRTALAVEPRYRG